tara:strand:- start:552 stop:1715 length:1164 start_codon:yes stop_codon:yes gene_type:complete
MSTLNVEGIKNTAATSDAISFATDGTCTARLTNPRSHRNLIVNGAMRVAQRGTSSTSSGYYTVDRFKYTYSGTDNAPTQAQVDVASGTTPYTLGFRKAYKITNANQTGGAGAGDHIRLEVNIEAQDIANSGWNYKSSSSYITLSFWCKSSVAQNFYAGIRTPDGTSQGYSFETGSLTADTWTKITKTIPGNSNLTFDNDAELGWNMDIAMFMGTNNTTSGNTMNQWAAYSGSNEMPDNTSTWYTTNGATWEITGVQLEVGDTATDFEHRTYADEILRCYRYFYKAPGYNSHPMFSRSTTAVGATVNTPVPMRTAPTSGPTNWVRVQRPGVDYGDSSAGSWTVGGAAPAVTVTGSYIFFQYGSMSNVTNTSNTVYGFLTYDLELNAEL